jgi:hypothetical protein
MLLAAVASAAAAAAAWSGSSQSHAPWSPDERGLCQRCGCALLVLFHWATSSTTLLLLLLLFLLLQQSQLCQLSPCCPKVQRLPQQHWVLPTRSHAQQLVKQPPSQHHWQAFLAQCIREVSI